MKIYVCNLFIIFIIIALSDAIAEDKSHNILFTVPTATKSHFIFYSSIVKALARGGHKITVISPITSQKKTQNIEEIKLKGNLFETLAKNSFDLKFWRLWMNISHMMPKACIDSMKERDVPEILEKPYDLVVMPYNMANCYLTYVYEKQIPFVFVYPNKLHSHLHEVLGNIDLPSISSHVFLPFYYKDMTFLQRTASALFSFWDFIYNEMLETLPRMERECIKASVYNYSPSSPPLSKIQKNASLAIINSVRSLESPPRPHLLKVVHAGGVHIEPRGELSKDMQKWMDESGEEGFILFSLGSVITPSQMEPEHLQIFLNVFRLLKQKVLWKWDLSHVDNLPPNVKINKWIPQQDVLNHSKIRLFITHGGLLSTQEATYFSVPVVGLPTFGDQHQNMLTIEKEGWGKFLQWDDLNEKILLDTIQHVLKNESMHKIIENRSILMKDAPWSPAEEILFWINYILRHKGASHLQSPLADMPWYRIYNIDVWIFVIVIATLSSFAPIFLLYRCCMKLKIKKAKKE